MNLDPFNGLTEFLAVAELKSFTQAAARLGVTPTAVSHAIKTLETRTGVVLFQRTTRRVALTEAGMTLYARLRPAAGEIDDALAALSGYRDRPMGTLRLTVPRLSGKLLIEPLIPRFREAFPDVVLDISLDDAAVDLVTQGFDAGIRLGESIDKDMVAVRLTPDLNWSVVGAPAYFAKAGTPATPEALTGHQTIGYRFLTAGTAHRWEFARAGRVFTVGVQGGLIVNDRNLMIAAARAGQGLAYVSDFEVVDDLASGALVQVLQSFVPPSSGLYLYFPSRTQNQPKLRAFIDLATAWVASRPPGIQAARSW
ncbi:MULTISPECIES: LysR family transcriptional regulator [unclassified Pseudomonas]|uniref:LysR family transcriptional regulator n=1 Tax=unclassified Pseudomonas TaxID=196821 RepID=UPI0015A0B904|nr:MULTISPECIES: LysR family transcriptional regulator [unclassified Pseudomonas]NWC92801.1 LysR family transcriptional regulator [Pseudomonas sp. IPO3779]NWD17515.1 LysR family transcriptional regulator [Pseudomonas sp. IPO3778]